MRKLLCILMSLMMLVLPMSGMAHTVNEMVDDTLDGDGSVVISTSIKLSEQLKSLSDEMALAADLYNSATMTYVLEKNKIVLMPTLGDAALSISLEVTDDALYIGSSLLEKPIIVDVTELTALAKNYVLPMLAQYGVISEEDAATYSGWVDQIAAGEIPEELQAILMSAIVAAQSVNDDMQISTDNIMNWAMGVISNANMVEGDNGTGIPGVTTSTVITFNQADLAALADAIAADLQASTIPALDMVAQYMGTDAATLMSAVCEALKEGVQVLQGMEIAMYNNDQGDVVAVSITVYTEDTGFCVTVVNGGDDNASSLTVEVFGADNTEYGSAVISWLGTVDAEETYTLSVIASFYVGEQGIVLELTADKNTVDLPRGSIQLTCSANDTVLGAVTGELSTDVEENQAFVYANMNLNVMGIDMMTAYTSIIMGPAVLPSIATPDAVRLFSTSQEELSAWLEGAVAYAQQGLMEIINALPESAQALMN